MNHNCGHGIRYDFPCKECDLIEKIETLEKVLDHVRNDLMDIRDNEVTVYTTLLTNRSIQMINEVLGDPEE